MSAARMCVAALFVAVVAVPGAKVRRSYVDVIDIAEDASIAGDRIGIPVDCSDDDSSESVELAYIVMNKREAPADPLVRSSPMTRQDVPASVAANFTQSVHSTDGLV